MASYENYRDLFEKREDLRRQVQEIIEKLEPWKEFDAKMANGLIPADAQLIYGKVGPLATQPGIFGCWECLFIKHGDGYDLIENQPCYQAIVAHGDWVVLEEYFALQRIDKEYTLVPLALQTIAPTFGDLPAQDIRKPIDRGNYRIRRELYLPTEKQLVQLDLPFLTNDPLEFIDQRLRSLHDPLVLKLIYVALKLCQKRNKNYFYYEPNVIADQLGYSRSNRGYHQRSNIERIEKKFGVLIEATYRWEVPWGNGVLKFEGPLLHVDKSSVEFIKEGRVLVKGARVYFYPELFEEISEKKRFAWIDNECLKLNALMHGKAFLFYSYYCSQLSLGIRDHGRKIRQRLRHILKRAGVKIGRNKTRDLEAIKREHNFLVETGLVTTWYIFAEDGLSRDPLDDIWEITMPDDHPAWLYWQKKQELTD